MYVMCGQNIDSATCLLGSLNNLGFAYVHKVLQNIASATCLLGSLNNLEFAYVHKVLAE